MAITLDGTNGITTVGGYTGDGVVLADNTPANTLVTTTGGNVGVGTATPTNKLQSNIAVPASVPAAGAAGHPLAVGSTAYGVTTGALTNGNGYIQVTRWDGTATNYDLLLQPNGGNLLVGSSSQVSGEKFLVSGSTTGWFVRFRNSQASGGAQGIDLAYTAQSPNNTDSPYLFCTDTSALRMSVRSNGGIANFSGNNVNLSDRREKTNFAPSKSYLDVICSIPVQTFNYIDQPEDDPGSTLGVVAQDVQAVAPELVSESNWGTEEAPKMRLSIYQTDLQYALMKCIQEQQTIITQLQADVAALKGATP
jgi:hypothetical protein